jgi:hydrogenase/urease accessory protein HupE
MSGFLTKENLTIIVGALLTIAGVFVPEIRANYDTFVSAIVILLGLLITIPAAKEVAIQVLALRIAASQAEIARYQLEQASREGFTSRG